MQVVFLTNAPDGGTFRLGSHHLSRELARLGHDVAHVSTPISGYERLIRHEIRSRRNVFGSARLDDSRSSLLRRNGLRDRHGVLQGIPGGLVPIRWHQAGGSTLRFLRRIGFDKADVFLVDQLMFHASLSELSGTIVYRPTDSAPAGLGQRLELAVLSHADAVVACSPYVWDSLVHEAGVLPHIVLENGVEDIFFESNEPGLARRGIAYVGAIDYRFDWELVIGLAIAFPDVEIRLAGPVTAMPEPSSVPPNVTLVGPLKYERVPAFLQSAQVGLLPFGNVESNLGRSPMKFYEYLASELYVVGRATPSLTMRDGTPGSWLYTDMSSAISATRSALEMTHPNRDGGRHARAYEWKARASKLDEFLTELVGAKRAENESNDGHGSDSHSTDAR